MPQQRDRAICLRKIEYSETSQILTLMTYQHGIVRAIAKGAHRRTKAGASSFDGGIDLLDYGEALWVEHTSRELSTLTQWKLLDGFLGLRQSLRAMLLAQAAAEAITVLLADHDPHPMLFGRLRMALPRLAGAQREAQFVALLSDAIQYAGFLPDWNELPGLNGAGGAVAVRLASMIANLPRERGAVRGLPELTPLQVKPLTRALLGHVEAVTQKPLQTRRFV